MIAHRKINRLLVISAFLCMYSLVATAQIAVDNMVIYFSPENPIQEQFMVFNSSTKKALRASIKVTALNDNYISDDGINNGVATDNDIIISPTELSLNAGAKRRIKAILKSPAKDKERAYRIKITPYKIADNKYDGKVSDRNEIAPQVDILTGVGMLAFSLPKNPKYSLNTTRKEGKIIFTNQGNINFVVGQEVFCNEENCFRTPGKRIYPHKSWELSIPEKLEFEDLTFKIYTYNDVKRVEVKHNE